MNPWDLDPNLYRTLYSTLWRAMANRLRRWTSAIKSHSVQTSRERVGPMRTRPNGPARPIPILYAKLRGERMMEFQDSRSDRLIPVTNPEDGAVIEEIEGSTQAHTDQALKLAFAARDAPRMPAYERSRVLMEVADRVRQDAEAFARLIASEGIKTIRESRLEVARCVTTLQLSAEEAKRIDGQVISMDQVPAGFGKLGLFSRVPGGLIVAMTPFNDPLNLVAHKVGPAVALGAPIIVKPHQKTPLSAIKLREAFIDSGLGEDLFQLVHGAADVGAQLVRDSRPRAVSFTGSRRAGRQVAKQSGFKKLLLELGGVGIVVVAADADVEAAAKAIHSAAFSAAGQNCLHAQRVIVDQAVADELRQKLVDRAKAIKLGCKLDERTDMGCCIDEAATQRILDLLHRSITAGAELLTGGSGKGTQFEPTWLATDSMDNPMAYEEVFGPVALLERARNFTDVLGRLKLAEDTPQISIFTASLTHALAVYNIAHAAAILINESTDFRLDAMPFGGSGSSGLEREGVRYAIEAFSEPKMLIIQPPNAMVA